MPPPAPPATFKIYKLAAYALPDADPECVAEANTKFDGPLLVRRNIDGLCIGGRGRSGLSPERAI